MHYGAKLSVVIPNPIVKRPTAGNVAESAILNIGCRVDPPGAQHGAARRVDVRKLGGSDAEACQIPCPLFGLGLRANAPTNYAAWVSCLQGYPSLKQTPFR
jgi:hypothetical protein